MARKQRAGPFGVVYVRSDDLYTLLRYVSLWGVQHEDPEALRLVRNYAGAIPIVKRERLGKELLERELPEDWRRLAEMLAQAGSRRVNDEPTGSE